jgi:hypothetical protein
MAHGFDLLLIWCSDLTLNLTADSLKRLLLSRNDNLIQQIGKSFQARRGHMPELTFMKLANRLVQLLQELQAFGSDARLDYAPVVLLPLARNQSALFHAIEKAGHIRIVRDHAVSDVAASQAFGLGSAQDPQDVVLRAGQPVGFEQLLGLLAQSISNFLQGNEDMGLQ